MDWHRPRPAFAVTPTHVEGCILRWEAKTRNDASRREPRRGVILNYWTDPSSRGVFPGGWWKSSHGPRLSARAGAIRGAGQGARGSRTLASCWTALHIGTSARLVRPFAENLVRVAHVSESPGAQSARAHWGAVAEVAAVVPCPLLAEDAQARSPSRRSPKPASAGRRSSLRSTHWPTPSVRTSPTGTQSTTREASRTRCTRCDRTPAPSGNVLRIPRPVRRVQRARASRVGPGRGGAASWLSAPRSVSAVRESSELHRLSGTLAWRMCPCACLDHFGEAVVSGHDGCSPFWSLPTGTGPTARPAAAGVHGSQATNSGVLQSKKLFSTIIGPTFAVEGCDDGGSLD